MNFEDEEYVRLYCKDTVTVRKIGWEGRLVLWEIMRKVDLAGVLDLQSEDDEVEAVATLIGVPEEIVRVGLERLSSRGVTTHHGPSLVVTKFVEAQNAKRSDRLRAQEYRDRKKLELSGATREPSQTTRESDEASRCVTDNNESSLPALPPPAPPHSHTHRVLAEPSREHLRLGAELGVDVNSEFARFKAQARGKGRQMADESACFELWLRDEGKRPKRSEPRASPRNGGPAQCEDDLRRARNLAIENAEAGRYGPKAREAVKTLRGAELTAYADRLAKTPPPPLRLAADG